MSFVSLSKDEGVATVVLQRGKVNALSEPMIEEMRTCFEELAEDRDARSIILTGAGKFFSFGFDIPEFLDYPKDDFIRFLRKFTGLYTYMFTYPKPIVAALNGHTLAGGCMLATACDLRLMVAGRAKISLNEISFGSSVFAGSAAMLEFLVGPRNAQAILTSGDMYPAEEARQLGLVDRASSEDELPRDAKEVAQKFALKDPGAFKSIKNLLRRPVAEKMIAREEDSIIEFTDIWYSEATREKLKEIKIHS